MSEQNILFHSSHTSVHNIHNENWSVTIAMKFSLGLSLCTVASYRFNTALYCCIVLINTDLSFYDTRITVLWDMEDLDCLQRIWLHDPKQCSSPGGSYSPCCISSLLWLPFELQQPEKKKTVIDVNKMNFRKWPFPLPITCTVVIFWSLLNFECTPIPRSADLDW